MEKSIKNILNHKKVAIKNIIIIGILVLIVVSGFVFNHIKKESTYSNIVDKYKNAKIGATLTKLAYADVDNIIFYDYPGLLIYNFVKKEFVGGINLDEYNMTIMQGDSPVSINVTDDGNYVTLDNGKSKYIYNIAKDKISQVESFEEKYISVFDMSGNVPEELVMNKLQELGITPISDIVKIGIDKYVYLFLNYNYNKLSGIQIGIYSDSKNETIPIFQ